MNKSLTNVAPHVRTEIEKKMIQSGSMDLKGTMLASSAKRESELASKIKDLETVIKKQNEGIAEWRVAVDDRNQKIAELDGKLRRAEALNSASEEAKQKLESILRDFFSAVNVLVGECNDNCHHIWKTRNRTTGVEAEQMETFKSTINAGFVHFNSLQGSY